MSNQGFWNRARFTKSNCGAKNLQTMVECEGEKKHNKNICSWIASENLNKGDPVIWYDGEQNKIRGVIEEVTVNEDSPSDTKYHINPDGAADGARVTKSRNEGLYPDEELHGKCVDNLDKGTGLAAYMRRMWHNRKTETAQIRNFFSEHKKLDIIKRDHEFTMRTQYKGHTREERFVILQYIIGNIRRTLEGYMMDIATDCVKQIDKVRKRKIKGDMTSMCQKNANFNLFYEIYKLVDKMFPLQSTIGKKTFRLKAGEPLALEPETIQRNIKDLLRAGDKVNIWNKDSGQYETAKIKNKYEGGNDELMFKIIYLDVDGKEKGEVMERTAEEIQIIEKGRETIEEQEDIVELERGGGAILKGGAVPASNAATAPPIFAKWQYVQKLNHQNGGVGPEIFKIANINDDNHTLQAHDPLGRVRDPDTAPRADLRHVHVNWDDPEAFYLPNEHVLVWKDDVTQWVRGTIRAPRDDKYIVQPAGENILPLTVDRKNIRGRVVADNQWQAPFYGTGAGEPNVVGDGSANEFLKSEIDPLEHWDLRMLESYVRHLIATTEDLTVKKCLNYPRGVNGGTGQIPVDENAWKAAKRRLDPIEHKNWKKMKDGNPSKLNPPPMHFTKSELLNIIFMQQNQERMEARLEQLKNEIPSAWKIPTKEEGSNNCWKALDIYEQDDLSNLDHFEGNTRFEDRRLTIDNKCLKNLKYPKCNVPNSACYVPLLRDAALAVLAAVTNDNPPPPTPLWVTVNGGVDDVTTDVSDNAWKKIRPVLCKKMMEYDKCTRQIAMAEGKKDKTLALKHITKAIEVNNLRLKNLSIQSIPTAESTTAAAAYITLGSENGLPLALSELDDPTTADPARQEAIDAARAWENDPPTANQLQDDIKDTTENNMQIARENMQKINIGNDILQAMQEEVAKERKGAVDDNMAKKAEEALEDLYIKQLKITNMAEKLQKEIQDEMWDNVAVKLSDSIQTLAGNKSKQIKYLRDNNLYIDWITSLENRYTEAHEPTSSRITQIEALQQFIVKTRHMQIAENTKETEEFLKELTDYEMNKALGFGFANGGILLRKARDLGIQYGTRLYIQDTLEKAGGADSVGWMEEAAGKGTFAGMMKDIDGKNDWGGNFTDDIKELVENKEERKGTAKKMLLNTLAMGLAAGLVAATGPGASILGPAMFMMWKSGIVQNMKKDPELIGNSIKDVIVEPARQHMIPGFIKVKENAIKAGALGVTISGAGPSVIAFSKSSANLKKISLAISKGFASANTECQTIICKPSKGASK